MAKYFFKREVCRLCDGMDLEIVVPLGSSPVSEKYVDAGEIDEPSLSAPLDLYFCRTCKHVQLLDVIDPVFLWSDLTFETGRDPKLIAHFDEYAADVIKRFKISQDDLIIDVGSNDGTLLSCFQELGYRNVLGVDPATEIVRDANERGIRTIEGFLDLELSDRINQEYGVAKVVLANNVFAHVDDLSVMARAIANLLSPNGVFTFEASYLLDVVQKNLIGTIFHEHLSYHSIISLEPFLERQGLELFDVRRGPEQGGSIVGFVQKNGGGYQVEETVKDLKTLEHEAGLREIDVIGQMGDRLGALKKNVQEYIEAQEESSKTVSGFGAARAGTTLLSYFGVGSQLTCLYDDNEKKHGKFSPGDRLEVRSSREIYQDRPDALIILAWIHADKIIEAHQEYLEQGGVFIRLHPEFEVVRLND